MDAKRRIAAVSLSAALLVAGCEKDKDRRLGDGHDFGENSPDLCVAMGDSITAQGWPAKLEIQLGKRVINAGVPGATSGDGATAVRNYLGRYRPGFLLIYYGANDVIRGISDETILRHLAFMVDAAVANKTIPIIATMTPMNRGHAPFQSAVIRVNEQIRTLARDRKVTLVDLEKTFSLEPDLLLSRDGLHPTDAGLDAIAASFYEVFR